MDTEESKEEDEVGDEDEWVWKMEKEVSDEVDEMVLITDCQYKPY